MQSEKQQLNVHEALDVDNSATLKVTANLVKGSQRRASANMPNHNDKDAMPDVVRYLSKARIKWRHNNDRIMIITKAKDHRLLCYTRGLTEWLITKPRFGKQYPFTVYVDGHLEYSNSFKYHALCEKNSIFKEKLRFWTPKLCYENPGMFHLIITLGGDGTVLFTSWLFQTAVPPVMSFHLGSLNFLAPFPYDHHRKALDELFEGEQGFRNTLRMRLSCTVYRVVCKKEEVLNSMAHDQQYENENITSVLTETAWMKKQLLRESNGKLPEAEREQLKKAIPCYTTVPCETYEVLNELVVDRGPSAYMSMLELFGDERHLTTVQADGIVIASPTGSTAYSLSAHGSLTHPDIRALLVTPICPHTLSFRPMLLPETMTIRVVVPFGSNKPAYCSFDGKNRVELRSGDHVKITMSPYPFPTVCRTESSNDWFSSLQSSLHWNVRQRQKSFLILESDQKARRRDRNEGENDFEQDNFSSSCSENLIACLQVDQQQQQQLETEDDGGEECIREVNNNQHQGIPMWTNEELNV